MPLPQGFTYLNDPRILLAMAYATKNNFVGRVIQDYYANVCIMTEAAANALIKAQDALQQHNPNYRLKIFDTYRPTTAVLDFKHWSLDAEDQKMKDLYYPDITKLNLFEKGYIAEKSAHSRGSTVDLTITELKNYSKTITNTDSNSTTYTFDEELDMGTAFDFFGERSHTANPNISDAAKSNRALLKEVMESVGFENYHLEWWHFTLKNEPFPDTYFSFPVK